MYIITKNSSTTPDSPEHAPTQTFIKTPAAKFSQINADMTHPECHKFKAN